MLVTDAVATTLTNWARRGTRRPHAQGTFPNTRPAVGYAAWSESAATDEIGAAVQSNQMTTKPSEKGAATMKLTTMTQVTVST